MYNIHKVLTLIVLMLCHLATYQPQLQSLPNKTGILFQAKNAFYTLHGDTGQIERISDKGTLPSKADALSGINDWSAVQKMYVMSNSGHIYSLSSFGVRQLLLSPKDEHTSFLYPSWSSDGRAVVFNWRELKTQSGETYSHPFTGIAVYTQSGHVKSITDLFLGYQAGASTPFDPGFTAPRWSPDSKYIAFSAKVSRDIGSDVETSRSEIFVATTPCVFSDTNKCILYNLTEQGLSIAKIAANDINSEKWTTQRNWASPAWSPVGSELAFACDDAICVMDIGTTQLSRYPLPKQPVLGVPRIAWTPQGDAVVFIFASLTTDIYRLNIAAQTFDQLTQLGNVEPETLVVGDTSDLSNSITSYLTCGSC